jgi:hypothetical protein
MALDSDKLEELLDVLPDDIDEFLDLVGSKAPQPKSAAQVRSILDKIKGRVREPTEKARPEWFE